MNSLEQRYSRNSISFDNQVYLRVINQDHQAFDEMIEESPYYLSDCIIDQICHTLVIPWRLASASKKWTPEVITQTPEAIIRSSEAITRSPEVITRIPEVVQDELVHVKKANAFLECVYNKSASSSKEEILSFIFESIENAFFNKNIFFINEVLYRFDPSKTQIIASTGLARVTFRARSKLESWYTCVTRIWEFLSDKGENPQRLLRGLVVSHDQYFYSTRTPL
jgi:hypothetical protein